MARGTQGLFGHPTLEEARHPAGVTGRGGHMPRPGSTTPWRPRRRCRRRSPAHTGIDGRRRRRAVHHRAPNAGPSLRPAAAVARPAGRLWVAWPKKALGRRDRPDVRDGAAPRPRRRARRQQDGLDHRRVPGVPVRGSAARPIDRARPVRLADAGTAATPGPPGGGRRRGRRHRRGSSGSRRSTTRASSSSTSCTTRRRAACR